MRRGDGSQTVAGLRENDGRVAEVESARETAREHVEQLAHGKRAHDVVEDVHQRSARRGFVEQALHLGLCFAQCRAQLLDFFQLRGHVGGLVFIRR